MTARPLRRRWVVLLLLALLAFLSVAVPVMLIRPFAPQTPSAIAISYALRRWSPWLTIGFLGLALLLVRGIWQDSPRWFARIAALVPLLLLGGTAWMARQNHFEWMFAPLPGAGFVRAGDAGEVAADDMVLAVAQRGDAAAYPVRQLAYHHLVEDEVGGVPIVATY
jgi:hypothetical protein